MTIDEGGCERFRGKLATGQLASYNQHHMPRYCASGEGKPHKGAEQSSTFLPGTPGGGGRFRSYLKVTEASCMKKVVLASFLACATIAAGLPIASAQDAAPAAQAAPAAGAAAECGAAEQMPAAEYAVYNNAMTQATPQAKAAGLEQYLTQFPQSSVKSTVLEGLMVL